MDRKKIVLLIELILICLYLFMIIFSIEIQPFNLILAIICVLFLPGYHLLNILKPQSKLIEKLGLAIIVSLAIENIIMLFTYIFIYNFVTWPDNTVVFYRYGFYFNPFLLNIAIQAINLSLIYIYKIKYSKRMISEIVYPKKIYSLNINCLKKKLKIKSVIVSVFYFLSLFLLCLSTLYSNVSNNGFDANYQYYRSNFAFFYRVPFTFYIFLIASIICLTYIILFLKNHLIILICISAFIYCLCILPYLQIGNYFSLDSYNLFIFYEDYLIRGVDRAGRYAIFVKEGGSQRYSTSIFTMILLTYATNLDINFVIWYLFPLIYAMLPFFFYSVFKKNSNKNEINDVSIIILTIFATLTPQIIKSGHSASTSIFGIIIFFILVVEFFNLTNEATFKIKNILIIVLLYFFLCLTHFEECLYFLVIIGIYSFYFLFFKRKKIESDENLLFEKSINLAKFQLKTIQSIVNRKLSLENVTKNSIFLGILLLVLSLIFYFTTEFFGWINYYFKIFPGILNLYNSTKISVPFIHRGEIMISMFVLGIIFIVFIIFILGSYLLFIKFFDIILKIYSHGIKIIKMAFNLINKLISKRFFLILIIVFTYSMIVISDLLLLSALEEFILVTIIALILSYFIFIFHLILFLKGFKYYIIENDKQNYYLISIISTSVIIVFLSLYGIVWHALYLIQTKFLTYFIFLNLIIIQNTYFKKFLKKNNKKTLFLLITLLLALGVFYSLRALRFG